MKCKNCGHEFESGTFCPECGTKCEAKELNVEGDLQDIHGKNIDYDEISRTKKKVPWYLNGFFIFIVFCFTIIPGIILWIIRLIKCKERRLVTIVTTILVFLIPSIYVIYEGQQDEKSKNEIQNYIESGNYKEAKEKLDEKLESSNGMVWYELYADLYEKQGDYDGIADVLLEYCSKQKDVSQIPSRITQRLYDIQDKVSGNISMEIDNIKNEIIRVEESRELAKRESEELERKESEEIAKKESEEQERKELRESAKREVENETYYQSEMDLKPGLTEDSVELSDSSDVYTPITFPYNNKKSSKLIDLYEKALNHQDDLIYIQPDKIVSDYALSYKQSIEWSEYLYYGDIKKGKPDGQGLIFKDSLIIYMGNFSKGSLNGYGIRFSENSEIGILYEGEWKDGQYNGNGIEYNIFYNENILNQIRRYYDEQRELNENLETNYGHQAAINMKCIIDKPFPPAWISYEGSFKKGNKSGMGKEYYYDLDWDTDVYVDRDMADIYVDMDMDKVYLGYEGEFKENRFDGKGTLYYPPGNQVQYKGEFKEGEYNGKGTLYNEDGSVNYKGKFKNGEIK